MAGLFSAKTVSAPPAASWPNACATFAPCRKANRSGAPDAASSSALICRRRGDESHFNPSCWFLIRASSRRLLHRGEFENWAVIALGGIPNKVQVGDMGVDGRIFPVFDNSPAIYGWVHGSETSQVPSGTKGPCGRPPMPAVPDGTLKIGLRCSQP